jgi:bifunctional DNA-binding transcriptional regulator/antitoxin component of YhaV-PrlF toxin-antitoxin module
MSEPHGPIRISANRQMALPKALMDRLRLQPGDMVYVMHSESGAPGLLVVPVERVSEWIRLGQAAERDQARETAERMQSDG